MLYRSKPLTTATYHDIPLRSIMSPPIEGSGLEREAMFDAWFAAIKDGETGQFELPEDVYEYIKAHGNNPVNLLFALGNSEPAKLHIGRTYIQVDCDETSFGFKDGVIMSRFHNGETAADYKPFEQLNRMFGGATCDSSLIKLWRHAYDVQPDAREALIALKVSNPKFDFAALLRRCATIKILGDNVHAELEDIIFNASDPVIELYVLLVPGVLSVKEFQKIVGVYWKDRHRYIDTEARLKILDKVLKFFWGN